MSNTLGPRRGSVKCGFSRGRRSSCTEDGWLRFRLMFSQDQLDKLSYCFGELEAEDHIGENQIKVDRRLIVVCEKFFGEELLADLTSEQRHLIARRTLQQQGLSVGFLEKEISAEQIMTFEQFLNFLLAYIPNAQDAHHYRGYPQHFALKVRSVMRERGAVPISEVPALITNSQENPNSYDDDCQGSKSLKSISLTQDGRDARKEAIAIKTASLFKVLNDLGMDGLNSGEDQKRVLREVQRIDPDDTGFFSLNQMLALFRTLDSQWEISERRQQIAIIDETNYLERDVDNLKTIFNVYAEQSLDGEKPVGNEKVTISVAQFREFFRALDLNLNKNDTGTLKQHMSESFLPGTEKIDFSGFCRCMKKLENENFCGLKAVMGRKEEVEIDVGDGVDRQLSYFERKAASTKQYGQ